MFTKLKFYYSSQQEFSFSFAEELVIYYPVTHVHKIMIYCSLYYYLEK